VHQVAGVLAHLKAQHLVHRDLKPGNLMLTAEGRVVLIDLGFAVCSGQATASATTVGTVEYIAPEQARGEANLDSRADIYSLGATLYHLVVGEPPFSGEARADVLQQQVFAEISSEKIKALRLSPRLHYFIEKMMAKDREVRYQEPAEIVADLEEKLGAELAPPPPAADRKPRRRRLSRRRR
jgi:serine/threonine-protein kinase